jgi:hypothetical protein
MADATRYMLGCGDRGDRAASALLGRSDVQSIHLDDLIQNDEFLASIVLTDTGLLAAAKHCFDFVTVRAPIEMIQIDEVRVEGVEWLSYFLSVLPREAMGGWDYTGIATNPDAPLVSLLRHAEARLQLAEFVQGLFTEKGTGIGFTPGEIAVLAGTDVRTVRNVMGPKGDKPIRSHGLGKERSGKNDLVHGDPLDALEWLAGRRAFHPGRLSTNWVNEKLSEVRSAQAAAAIPGVIIWLNRSTTKDFAKSLNWPLDRLRKWLRAEGINPADAKSIAVASGLDPTNYSSLIAQTFAAT